MNIFVCVKHVPDSAVNIAIVDEKRIDDSVAFLLNPYDEHALTEASRIREDYPGSQVIAFCLGKPDAEKTVRSAMAMGADKGVLIETHADHDSMITARALKAAIDQEGQPDMIFTGRESIDAEGMQTMFRIGALYGYPVATNVVKLELKDQKAIVDTEFSGGVKNTYELSLPCVIGAGRGLNTPKYPTFRDVMLSKKKPVKTLGFDSLAVVAPPAKMETIRLEPLAQNRVPEEITGDDETIAQKIVTILKTEAKVI